MAMWPSCRNCWKKSTPSLQSQDLIRHGREEQANKHLAPPLPLSKEDCGVKGKDCGLRGKPDICRVSSHLSRAGTDRKSHCSHQLWDDRICAPSLGSGLVSGPLRQERVLQCASAVRGGLLPALTFEDVKVKREEKKY